MEDTFTTTFDIAKDGIKIYTVHDQTGSIAPGFVPRKNIQMLIEALKNIFSEVFPEGGDKDGQ